MVDNSDNRGKVVFFSPFKEITFSLYVFPQKNSMFYSQRIIHNLRFQYIIWSGKAGNRSVKPHVFAIIFPLHLPPPTVFPSKEAELKHEVGCPRKELSNSHGGNVLILKGSKDHRR